ncbi:glycoside hydrolase family 9 protein [Candidatus Binatia bacterium]|nr:glycoside hydrolase family 9 protein [Candidatus Binatia bacterium]
MTPSASIGTAAAVALGTLLSAIPAGAAPVSQAFKLDHFGYRTGDPKIVIVTSNPGTTIELRTPADTVAFTIPTDGGSIAARGADGPASGDNVWWVDFGSFATSGTYRLYSPAMGAQSYDFEIADDVYADPVRTALHTFYLQRCNTPKTATHAGVWADTAACHMTDTTTGPAAGHNDYGSKNLAGGWHDAGDYNKYVWGAVSQAIRAMLRAYEQNPTALRDDDTNIPESGNGTPDLLDEIEWELDWMLAMQLPDGSVLSQMHVNGYASTSPPSADPNVRYYRNPDLESGSVAAGTFALASRFYDAVGMTTYATTLRNAALSAWAWLAAQPQHSHHKVWAAAEIFRMDPSQTAAQTYVDNYHPGNWGGVFFNVVDYDTFAALTYVDTPGATAAVVSNMRADIADQVDYIFSENDLYRNGMPAWSYYWGSNAIRAGYGLFLIEAARLDATGSHTTDECRQHALDLYHFFHGQNALNMLYLTNMAARGGEHSSFQFYHSWFGDSASAFSLATFMGKPPGIVEPDYPYFKGTDNFGIGDNKTSTLGPPPGFVTGGPNKDYAGTASPPLGAVYYNRFYRDWADQTEWTVRSWEITENSIGYEGPYVALGAYFLGPPVCDNNGTCAGAETVLNCPGDCSTIATLDAYLTYKASAPGRDAGGVPLANGNALPSDWIVTVNDRHLDDAAADDPENFEVRGVVGVTNPLVRDAGGPPLAPERHYLRYAMLPGPQSVAPAVDGVFPKPTKHIGRIWQLHNGLGTVNVQSLKVRSLWLPASTSTTAAPAAPSDATHYVCYGVKPTRDGTDQTPGGKLAGNLQAFVEDEFDDCALDAAGSPSFAGSAAEGKCLFDLQRPVELCNPMDKSAVQPPRQSSATVAGSTASNMTSLLCYKARLAARFKHAGTAALANAAVGASVSPAQAKHVKRRAKNGNPLYSAPGNLFPNPVLVDTTRAELICLPSDVLGM